MAQSVRIIGPLETNGGVPVNIQDQTTTALDIRLCQAVTGPYTLASDTVPNTYTIVLTDATGLTAGDRIGLFQDSTNPLTYFGRIISISTNTLTMDTPMDGIFYTSLSPVLFEILCNMNVNGSVTPQVFSVDNDATISIDITRIIIHITDATAMDDSLFGGLSALTRGVVIRKKKADGTYSNYMNGALRTNGTFGLMAFDKVYDDKAPAGVYGLSVRYSFAGIDKHGVVCRLAEGEELQCVVQDDLTGLLTFEMVAEGHYVTD